MEQPDYGPAVRFEGPDEIRNRLARVRERLELHGVSIPPGRLARFEKLSEGFAARELSAAHPGFPRDLEELLEGTRDFLEFATIVAHLLPQAPPANPAVISKVRIVLGGAPLPSEDTNPLARNTQFELYVGALLTRAGLAVTLTEPPDFLVTVGHLQLGVAVKRAGGPRGVPRLVKEAASQLRRAGLDGIVAMSFDLLFRPKDERLFRPSVEEMKPEAPRIIEATVRPYFRELDRAAAGGRALALFAFVAVPCAIPETNSVGRLQTSYLHEMRQMSRPHRAALIELYHRTGRCLSISPFGSGT